MSPRSQLGNNAAHSVVIEHGEFKSQLMPIFFFFNDTATTEIYTLSLHDALPICLRPCDSLRGAVRHSRGPSLGAREGRSEEHTSELQSQSNLVCRLLLEKKKERPL